jgi:RNA polymerase sigma-70 factor (ECF subfamily)
MVPTQSDPRRSPNPEVLQPTFSGSVCSSGTDDDTALVRKTTGGDQGAFGLLVRRYEKALFNLAFRMTGNREDAKDITQAAFVKAYENLESFNTGQRFFSWLYRIAINESLNWVKNSGRQEGLSTELPSDEDDPETAFRRRRTREAVQQALLRLSPDQRMVILLRHFNDLSYEDIGNVLGIPVKTVKSRLYSARQVLAGLLT